MRQKDITRMPITKLPGIDLLNNKCEAGKCMVGSAKCTDGCTHYDGTEGDHVLCKSPENAKFKHAESRYKMLPVIGMCDEHGGDKLARVGGDFCKNICKNGGGLSDDGKHVYCEKNMGITGPPEYAMMGGNCAMRLDHETGRYYRDAGAWEIGYRVSEGNSNVYVTDASMYGNDMQYLDGKSLVPCTKEQWHENNYGKREEAEAAELMEMFDSAIAKPTHIPKDRHDILLEGVVEGSANPCNGRVYDSKLFDKFVQAFKRSVDEDVFEREFSHSMEDSAMNILLNT